MTTKTKTTKNKTLKTLEAVVWSVKGEKAETITLPSAIFGAPYNADLIHQVVLSMEANARPTVAHTKFRGEVRGGGKKPWKQKGTGRARHGSRRSPIWVGGGTTHGPRAERDYSVKINKKMRVAALTSVLSKKFQDGEIVFVQSFAFAEPKTKEAQSIITTLAKAGSVNDLKTKRKNAAIIALSGKNEVAEKSFRNIPSLSVEEVRNINPVELLKKKYLVIENPSVSLPILEARVKTA